MEPILLTKYEAPLSGGPAMNVRRLANAATLCANALRVNGERFTRELLAMSGAKPTEEEIAEAGGSVWNVIKARLAVHLGERGAEQAKAVAQVFGEALEEIDEIEKFYSILPQAAGSVEEQSSATMTPAVPASPPIAATDAAAAAGSGVGGGETSIPSTETEPTPEVPGSGAVEGGDASTTAVVVLAPSSPGDAPGDAETAAAGDGPTSGEAPSATEVAAPSGAASGPAKKPRGGRR